MPEDNDPKRFPDLRFMIGRTIRVLRVEQLDKFHAAGVWPVVEIVLDNGAVVLFRVHGVEIRPADLLG